MKVSIIGAGNVGSALAGRILERDLADVVLIDIVGRLAAAKAIDLMHSAALLNFQSACIGSDDYSLIKNSDVIVITAGLTRSPGASREDLLLKNFNIVREICLKIKEFSCESIIVVVTNPLDIMTYTVVKTAGFDSKKVIGMAGVLDGARFSANIANMLKIPVRSIEAVVMGIHSNEMLPVISHTKVSDANITRVAGPRQLEQIIEKTRNAGTEIVSLLGSGSAYFAPSAGALCIVESILKDLKKTLICSVYLQGEYGISDAAIGVPVKIGRGGINKILEIKLSKEEKKALKESALFLKEKLSKPPF